jgi:phage-related protein
MYEVIFYKDVHGVSPVKELIIELDKKAPTNKDARIQLKQIYLSISLLEKVGTWSSSEVAKHIQNQIWELRPGNNRILFATWNDIYLLLHSFRKKTMTTPAKELERAKRELEDWEKRYGQ